LSAVAEVALQVGRHARCTNVVHRFVELSHGTCGKQLQLRSSKFIQEPVPLCFAAAPPWGHSTSQLLVMFAIQSFPKRSLGIADQGHARTAPCVMLRLLGVSCRLAARCCPWGLQLSKRRSPPAIRSACGPLSDHLLRRAVPWASPAQGALIARAIQTTSSPLEQPRRMVKEHSSLANFEDAVVKHSDFGASCVPVWPLGQLGHRTSSKSVPAAWACHQDA
jgi:hypothetical protein